jgi:transcriptional regulator with XRE-family HTH domain
MRQQIEEFVSFGEWVRRRRKMLDFTRVALAGLVACSADMIKKIERDERRPSLQLAELLAKQLQIPEQVTEKFLQMARGKYVPTLRSPLNLPAATPTQIIPSNLPQQLTPFIGREAELAEIATLLADPACRLLTLVGPGGMGKTRLALQAATEARDVFAHGVCYVRLAPLGSHEFLITTIADALNLSFHGTAEPKAQVMDYLQNKECLLLLDNFEHILAGATLLSKIVMAALGVKLLATSRERLNLQEEWVYDLQGMTFPETNADQTSKVSKTFEVLENDYSALQLFEQRARQAQATFDLAAEYPAVVRICQLVDGMPLGLELAASWINLMSCWEIVLEIEQNLDFLATSLRNVPERHRSLRAVFEHSWQLLSDEEKRSSRNCQSFEVGLPARPQKA